jgi:hypothetical protein
MIVVSYSVRPCYWNAFVGANLYLQELVERQPCRHNQPRLLVGDQWANLVIQMKQPALEGVSKGLFRIAVSTWSVFNPADVAAVATLEGLTTSNGALVQSEGK